MDATTRLDIDFVGIGFRRCATSWLNAVLAEHPQIRKPDRGVHFFNDNWDRGVGWYRQQLGADAARGPDIRLGEFCTTYSYPENAPLVAERLHALAPEARILACIREPVARLRSDYLRSVRRGELDDIGLEGAVEQRPDFLERGRYAPVLRLFMDTFGRERVKVVTYDAVSAAPAATLAEIFTFLDVDPAFRPSALEEKVGATYAPRSAGFEVALNRVQRLGGRALRAIGAGALLRSGLKRRLVAGLRRLNTAPPPAEPPETLRLRALYADDIAEVEALTGLDLAAWRGERR